MNGNTSFIACQGCRQAICQQAQQCMGLRTTDSAGRLAALEERLAQAEARIAQIERTRMTFGPIADKATPSLPVLPPTPFTDSTAKCGKCGITLSPVMSYCCSRGDCPCGLGGFSCTSAA